MRVTTLKGPDAGHYYLDSIGRYYLDATGEPAGVWHGRGLDRLGLDRAVDDDAFLRLMAGQHPTTGATLGREYTSRSVRGFDLTASAPKSVSVLWALGDDTVQAAVIDAHDRAVAAMLSWVENHALTRYRVNGEIHVVDATGLVAAAFRQHTSRALDPQLHTHLVLANRVRGDDARWLALDARGLKVDQRTLSALYHAGLRAELTASLGVEWDEPTNAIAEIAGIDRELLAEFSTRTNQITDRIDTKLARFTDTMGRPPTPRERWRLEREAVVDSRPAKQDGDARELHREWIARTRTLGVTPERLLRVATGAIDPRPLTTERLADAAQDALAAISEKQSTWRPAELVRELAAAPPTTTGMRAAELHPLLDATVERLIAARCVDLSPVVERLTPYRRDGRPVTEAATDRVLTTETILAQETRLLAWARDRQPSNLPATSIPTPEHLTGPQRHMAAAIAGHDPLVVIVGPAGTGKTTAIAPAIAKLHHDSRPVFGVAPSAIAADVLATETGVDADTLDKLLYEHRQKRPPQHRYDLPAGTTLIVDEAGMVGTANLAELAALSDARQWRIVLVGDPMQFSPVGRGGMYTLLCDTVPVIELDAVRRFTHEWERDASLRLRRSDPDVLALYDTHGRLHTIGPEAGITPVIDAWHAARSRGEDVLLMAPTNDTVARLNEHAQQRLLRTGELRRRGAKSIGELRLHIGDTIVTRENHRLLRTSLNHPVHNRDTWTIDSIGRNGDLTVTGPRGRVRLPRYYVEEHVELAYAQTSHAAQGRTVDTAILYLDAPTDTAGVYVPLTRGRNANHAYITATDHAAARDVLETSLAQRWIDEPAIAHARRLHPTDDLALRIEPLTAYELSGLIERRHDLNDLINEHTAALKQARYDLHTAVREHRTLLERLDRTDDTIQRSLAYLHEHDRPFHRRHHEQGIANSRHNLDHAEQQRPGIVDQLATARDTIATAQANLDRETARRNEITAARDELDHTTRAISRDHDNRARELRHHPDHETLTHYGPRPSLAHQASTWDHAAATRQQARALELDPTDRDHPIARDLAAAERELARAHRPVRELTRELERTIEHGINR